MVSPPNDTTSPEGECVDNSLCVISSGEENVVNFGTSFPLGVEEEALVLPPTDASLALGFFRELAKGCCPCWFSLVQGPEGGRTMERAKIEVSQKMSVYLMYEDLHCTL